MEGAPPGGGIRASASGKRRMGLILGRVSAVSESGKANGNGLPVHIEWRVFSDSVRRLYDYSLPIHLITLPAAILIATLLSTGAGINVWLWVWVVVPLELLRLALYVAFRWFAPRRRNPRFWVFAFVVPTALSALSWGGVGFYVVSVADPAWTAVTVLVMLIAAGYSLPLLVPVLWVYLFSLALILGPVLLSLMIHPGPITWYLAGLVSLAVALLVIASLRIWRDQQDAIRTRYTSASAADALRREVEERRRIEEELRQREIQMQHRKALLMDLAREPVISEGEMAHSLERVARSIMRGLDVERATVWYVDPEAERFVCRLLLAGEHTDFNPELAFDIRLGKRSRHAMEKSRALAVVDVQADPHAGVYWQDYFARVKTRSFLGAPFRREGRVRGFVMAESSDTRHWTEEDESFISSAVDFISLALAAADRRSAQRRLHQMATLDSLTRLPNRHAFQEYMDRALKEASLVDAKVGLLFVDLDRFKAVNDSLGHHAGDIVLQEMAQRLAESTRYGDWVARLAGDEFTVIVNNPEHTDTLRGIADRIRESLTEPTQLENHEITLTCSIGISVYPDDAMDAETLLQNADAAMYAAKQAGRNQYAFFTPELRERAVHRLSLDSELRRAIARDDLLLHYQPIVRADDGAIEGLEALVRWQREDGSVIPPMDFVPMAEENGLVVPIGEWVLDRAVAQLAEWDRETTAEVGMSVNFSMLHFRQGDLPALILETLERHGVAPQRLIVEITETDVLLGQGEFASVFEALRKQGVRVAIDDFGTGSSSLGQLKRLPVDILKLDRSFIRGLEDATENQAITRAVVQMAHALNLTVVAEGVESDGQYLRLQESGCRLMQGFLFSVPVPATEVPALLARNHAAITRASRRKS